MFEDRVLQIIQSYGTVFAAVGAVYFGYAQYQINKRLKDIQDFVALSIVLFVVENSPKIQIKNVGRINLYLHRWEIGGHNETYQHARLLGVGPELSFIVAVPDSYLVGVEMPVKLYLTDEYGQKYLSTGVVALDQQQIQVAPQSEIGQTSQQEQAAIKQFIVRGNIRAWSYRTIKFNWHL